MYLKMKDACLLLNVLRDEGVDISTKNVQSYALRGNDQRFE
jgi:hypothetical protein